VAEFCHPWNVSFGDGSRLSHSEFFGLHHPCLKTIPGWIGSDVPCGNELAAVSPDSSLRPTETLANFSVGDRSTTQNQTLTVLLGRHLVNKPKKFQHDLVEKLSVFR
jgi:hypothetical protein